MTVRELIAALSALDPNIDVLYADCECGDSDITDVDVKTEQLWNDEAPPVRVTRSFVRLS